MSMEGDVCAITSHRNVEGGGEKIYIYIYREREREREFFEITSHTLY
jgi:hypothetical protein